MLDIHSELYFLKTAYKLVLICLQLLAEKQFQNCFTTYFLKPGNAEDEKSKLIFKILLF